MAIRKSALSVVSLLTVGLIGCSGDSPHDPMGAGTPVADAGFDEDFEWPDAPDLMETIRGHWKIKEGGEIYFSIQEQRDDFGMSFMAGTYVPPEGDPIEFRWESRQNGFGALQEGLDYWFESMIGVTADTDLPFAPNSSTDLRFRPGKYEQGILSTYESFESMDRINFHITKIDTTTAP